jgi:hypothetical protein
VIKYSYAAVDGATKVVLRLFLQQMENGMLESPQAQSAEFENLEKTS